MDEDGEEEEEEGGNSAGFVRQLLKGMKMPS
jgi:hypothetical protein